jgi:hypothetical protein
MLSDSAISKYLKSVDINKDISVFMLADARNITIARYDKVEIDYDDNVILCYTLDRRAKQTKDNPIYILEHVVDLDQLTGILFNIDYAGRVNGEIMNTVEKNYLGGV